MLAVMLGITAFNASAGWQVNGTFCQTLSDDGRVLIRVKPATIGLIEQHPQCNGRGAARLNWRAVTLASITRLIPQA